MGSLLNSNSQSDRRGTGFSEGSATAAARRISERLSRIPAVGNRYRARYDHSRDGEEGRNTDEDLSQANQRNNREDGTGSSPMGFISQLIQQNPELSGVVKATEKYIPFLLIAAAKGFFDHATGIKIRFIWKLLTFFLSCLLIKVT